MNRSDRIGFLPAALVAAAAAAPASPAFATTYLSTEAAQSGLFPQAQSLDEVPITLTDAQRADIARAAGPQAPHGQLRAWAARADGKVIGHVFIDEVVGRQDFITYAVGIDAAGKLRPVEILEYRESHGGEIRNTRWLAQFDGRSTTSQLRFGTDIKNIAGATLSSEHVTAGVRRILAIWQAAFANAGGG
jgi:Na+-translocating ferredoxin:NAD+ oxidoreductase RnfG subunit